MESRTAVACTGVSMPAFCFCYRSCLLALSFSFCFLLFLFISLLLFIFLSEERSGRFWNGKAWGILDCELKAVGSLDDAHCQKNVTFMMFSRAGGEAS